MEHRDDHELRNTGEAPLRVLNPHVPPEYTQDGDPRQRGRGNQPCRFLGF
jgi:hypothetical protein